MKQAKTPIKVNFESHAIIVSRPFAIRAANPHSPEYQQLTNVQTHYPDYEIVVRTIKQPSSEHYKGLTYAYMEYYISTHKEAAARMTEYEEIRLRAQCHSGSYGCVKKWFLQVYPQIDDFTPEDYKKQFEPQDLARETSTLPREKEYYEPLAA
jgi:hypothetical protein